MSSTIVLITHDVDEALLVSDRVYVLTARPGRVKMVLDVDLPRPRSHEAVTQPEFTGLKAKLLAALREEILPAESRPGGFQPEESRDMESHPTESPRGVQSWP